MKKVNKVLFSLTMILVLMFPTVAGAAITTIHAGHGGVDPGAIGSGHTEAALARQITNQMVAKTGAFNATDDTATSVNDNLNKIVRNIKLKSSNGSDWNISNHLNAASPSATGVEVYYYGGDAEGKRKAEEISAAISKALGIPNRGARDGSWLYVLNNTPGHSLLIEWSFISNPSDVNKLLTNMDRATTEVVKLFGYGDGNGTIIPPVVEPSQNLNTAGQIIGGKYMKLDTLNQNKATADRLTNDYRKRYASYFLGKEVEAVPQGDGTYTITAKGLTHQQAVNLVPQFQRAVGGQVPNYRVTDTAGVIQPNGTYNIVASNIRTLNEAQKLVPALQQLSADALLSKRIYNGRQSKEGIYFTVILNLTLDQAVEFCAREKKNFPEIGTNIMGNWQL